MRRHGFFLLRSVMLQQSFCPLFIRCRNCLLNDVRILSSTAVPVNRVICGGRHRISQLNERSHQPVPLAKRFYTARHCNLNVRPSSVPFLSSRDAVIQRPVAKLHSAGARGYNRSQPNARSLTLSAKAIVEASPLYIQPYLRLIRLDRPIGTFLTLLSAGFVLFILCYFFTKKDTLLRFSQIV